MANLDQIFFLLQMLHRHIPGTKNPTLQQPPPVHKAALTTQFFPRRGGRTGAFEAQQREQRTASDQDRFLTPPDGRLPGDNSRLNPDVICLRRVTGAPPSRGKAGV